MVRVVHYLNDRFREPVQMSITRNLVSYYRYPIEKVIEAVVTNNLGYETDHERFPNSGRFLYVDCTGLSHEEAMEVDPNETDLPLIETQDTDIMQLHWHLSRLNGAYVLPMWLDERDRRLPCLGRMDYQLTQVSDDPRQN